MVAAFDGEDDAGGVGGVEGEVVGEQVQGVGVRGAVVDALWGWVCQGGVEAMVFEGGGGKLGRGCAGEWKDGTHAIPEVRAVVECGLHHLHRFGILNFRPWDRQT